MEPFSIQCTTCGVGLFVRSKAVIGQIHACPKCGSMVLVQRPAEEFSADPPPQGEPAGVSPSGTPHAAAAAAGEAATPPVAATFEEAAALFSDAPDPPPAAETAAAETSGAETSDGETPSTETGSDETPGAETGSVEMAGAETAAEPAVAQAAADLPLVPGAEWDSPSQRAWRSWAMYGGAAAMGAVLAIGVWGLVQSRLGKQRRLDSAGSTASAATPAGDERSQAKPDTRLRLRNDPDALYDGPPRPSSSTEPGFPTASEGHRTGFQTKPSAVQPADTPLDAATHGHPANHDPANDVAAPEDVALPDDPAAPGDLSPDDEAVTMNVSPEATLDEPSTIPRLPRPEMRVVDVEARLADAIPAIEFHDVELVGLLQFLTQLSTIPITLDPDALAAAGLAADTHVSVAEQDTTVAEVLGSALAPKRLGYVVDGGHLIVRKTGSADGKPRRLRYGLTDLVGNDRDALEAMAELVKTFVAPKAWQPTGASGAVAVEDGRLVITQTEENHWKAVVLFEKLRVARGQKPRSRFDPSLFRLATRSAKAREKLASPVTLNYHYPAPLEEILDRLRQATGVVFLIDWQSLGAEGWPPGCEATLVADNEPLGEALTAMLEPMDLAYRAVDEKTVQITSMKALDTRCEIEFYPAADLAAKAGGAEGLLDEIRQTLGESLFQDAGGAGALYVDGPSKCIIARLPQTEQRELERFLGRLRAGQ